MYICICIDPPTIVILSKADVLRISQISYVDVLLEFHD